MSTVRAGTIPSDLAVNPGDAIYVNGGGTWDTFTPSAGGGITIGDAVSGGGANRVLYEDGSQNLAASSAFTFASNTLTVEGSQISAWGNGSSYAAFGHKDAYTAGTYTAFALMQSSTGKTYLNSYGSSLEVRYNNSAILTMDSSGLTVGDGKAFIGANTSGTYFFDFTNNSDATLKVALSSPGAGDKFANLYSNTNSRLKFAANSVESLSCYPSGVVGVGTGSTTPSAFLEIVGTTEQVRVSYDSSNYYKTTVSSAGLVTFDAVGSGAGFTFSDAVTVNGTLTLSAQNIATDTTTGMKIGTGTTQKVGFFNATPVTQRSDIGALTDSTGGTPGGVIDDPSGGADTVDVSIVNDNFASLLARINSIRTALRDMGIMA